MNKVPSAPSETELISLKNMVLPVKSKATKGDGKPPIHSNTKRESSPTSVVSHEVPKNTKKRTPRVTMGDEGAEVSLSTPPPQRPPLADCTNVAPPTHSPENTCKMVHMNSLLDIDISPDATVENKEPEEPSLSASTLFCGSHGCLSQDSNDGCELVNAPQASIERTITLLLSDPSALDLWCNAWQAWFFFGVEVEQYESMSDRETKENMKRVLRNRAYDLNSRSRRIKTLKDELSPFDVTPPTVGASIPLTRTRSLGNEHVSRKSNGRHWSSSSSDTSLNLSVASFWESMPGCGHADSDSPAVIRSTHLLDDEDLCYDSDPEEMIRDRTRSDNSTFMAFSKSTNCLVETSKKRGNRKGDFVVPRRLDAAFHDDEAKDLVQDFMNEKQTLVWHRSAKPDAKHKGTPTAMIIWIERGQQLNSGLIQPKLVWRPVRKHERENIQRLGSSTSPSLDSLELLDISRVLEVNRIDRKLYPFAKRKCCFLVESLDRKMMFEASSEAERDRIVESLKLTVSRFAAKIIVQDKKVMDEFFSSFLSAVPGEAPRWAQESNNLSLL